VIYSFPRITRQPSFICSFRLCNIVNRFAFEVTCWQPAMMTSKARRWPHNKPGSSPLSLWGLICLQGGHSRFVSASRSLCQAALKNIYSTQVQFKCWAKSSDMPCPHPHPHPRPSPNSNQAKTRPTPEKSKTQAKNNEPKCFFAFFCCVGFWAFFISERQANWCWRPRLYLGIEIGICGIVFGFVYDFGQESLSAAFVLWLVQWQEFRTQNNGGHAHKMPKCHRGFVLYGYTSIYTDLRCYRRTLGGGGDFDKCLINFVPRSNIKPGYFLT